MKDFDHLKSTWTSSKVREQRVFEWGYIHVGQILSSASVSEISQETAVNPVDIVSTLQALQMLKYWKGKHLVLKRQVKCSLAVCAPLLSVPQGLAKWALTPKR